MGEFKGVASGDTKKFAQELSDMDITGVVRVNPHDEVETNVEMANPDWGMPGDLEDLMTAYDAVIVDFSHVTEDSIKLYLEIR